MTKWGTKLKHLLERKDPFSSLCKDSECPPCVSLQETKMKNQNCRKNNICYQVSCRNCEKEGKVRQYHGETARNLHGRGKEHYYVLNNKSEKTSMYKPVLKEHKGNADGIVLDWEVLGNFQKPLSRQIAEAIKMDNK